MSELQVLDAGVSCWLQPPARAGRPNAGVVIDADGATIIDTLLVPDQWQPFGDAVDELGVPTRRVVLTSSQIEHAGGTSRFKLAAIYGTAQCSVHLDQPPNLDVYRTLYAADAAGFDELVTRPVSHIVREDVQLTPAIQVLTTGGQQEENLVALVPGAAVLFAGAMCSFGVTPLCFQGDPLRWAGELDRLVELAPIIVPGHGPIGGEEEVRDLQAYLRACASAAGDPSALPAGPWDSWTDRHHDAVNVERAAMLARGDDAIPPSMLHLAGLDQTRLMQYRQLGDSDLQVSEISLGSWLTYGVGVERDAAEACMRQAFDEGINLIDTANAYGRGAAESFLGEVLADVPRDDYVLATKVFFPMSDTDSGLSAAQIRKQLDASLERLRVDTIDLYQCHRYDRDTPLDETMDALTEAVTSGKVRYIGFSEWGPAHVQDALDLHRDRGAAKFVSSQPQYSALWRRPEEKVIPLCAANGISQIVWSPLAQGVLTGKYAPGSPPPEDSRAASDEMGGMMDFVRTDAVLEAVQRLQPIADGAGISMAQLALARVLREPNVASAIIGATRPQQVSDNAAASGITLDADTLAAIDAALEGAVLG